MEEAAAGARSSSGRPCTATASRRSVAVRAPAVAGGSVGTADLIGVAPRAPTPTPRSSRSATASSPSARASTSTTRPNASLAEVAEEFIGQYYSASPAMPRRSSSAPTCASAPGSAEALAERRGAPVEVRVAERGDKRRLRELAERNARLALDQDRLRREHRRQRRVDSLADLREALRMEELPVRIEGFDISNLGGEHTVASMVVFEGGATKKADYRRFRVRGELRDPGGNGGPDDFASMEEVLGRRLNRYLEQVDLSPHDGKRDESFASLPSLILIDGGKGQLAAGMRALGAVRRARRHDRQPRQAAGGGLRPRPRRADRPGGRLGGLEAPAARP
jgi:excinuclease ABC subunit C